MSKDQKITSEQAVETVDKILDYCISTIEFWNIDDEWPINLIHDSLKTAKQSLKFIFKEKNVSDSNINDK